MLHCVCYHLSKQVYHLSMSSVRPEVQPAAHPEGAWATTTLAFLLFFHACWQALM